MVKKRKQQDWSTDGEAYKNMLKANYARTEESATKNSNWAPGALKRLQKTNNG
jgi:hypothetical protein